jgi:hypothetical protein
MIDYSTGRRKTLCTGEGRKDMYICCHSHLFPPHDAAACSASARGAGGSLSLLRLRSFGRCAVRRTDPCEEPTCGEKEHISREIYLQCTVLLCALSLSLSIERERATLVAG